MKTVSDHLSPVLYIKPKLRDKQVVQMSLESNQNIR